MLNLNTNLLSVAQNSSQLSSGPTIEEHSSEVDNNEVLASSLDDEDQANIDIRRLVEQQLTVYNTFSHIASKDPEVAKKMLAIFKNSKLRL